MSKLNSYIKNTNIYLLSLLPPIFGIIILVFGCSALSQLDVQCNDFWIGIFVILGTLTMGLTGIIQIYRREAPGIYPNFPITGWLAVVIGSIWVAMCWGVAIYLVFDMIMH